MIDGIITKGIGGFYYIDTEQGIYECRARGIFRKNKVTPLVGDNVKINIVDEDNKKGVLEEIKERETELVRPPISNVNKALIVFAIKNPNPNLSLLDRFIVLAEREGLEIVIILTKCDLATDEELKNLKMPVLIYGGRYDRVAVPEMMVKYKDYCPQAKFVMFEKSGHNPQVEEPEKLFPLIEGFLH